LQRSASDEDDRPSGFHQGLAQEAATTQVEEHAACLAQGGFAPVRVEDPARVTNGQAERAACVPRQQEHGGTVIGLGVRVDATNASGAGLAKGAAQEIVRVGDADARHARALSEACGGQLRRRRPRRTMARTCSASSVLRL